ncbi:type IV pilin protein [Candidatus Avelusimicrobium facis]|uniref:type IV pilin protein n=1 Tax=Candidatus Avelusimicrobium facis TaxID=3416203 RepID=UPI003D109EF9
MKNFFKNRLGPISACRGFTLLELLVVVLIIGVLTAVALPQYTKAVEKTRIMSGFPAGQAIVQAMDEYYLANGKFSGNWAAMVIQLPAGATDENGQALTSLPTSMNKLLYYGVGTAAKRSYRLQSNGRLQYKYYANPDANIYFYSNYATGDSYKPLRGKITCTYGNKQEEQQCRRLGAVKLKQGTYVF